MSDWLALGLGFVAGVVVTALLCAWFRKRSRRRPQATSLNLTAGPPEPKP